MRVEQKLEFGPSAPRQARSMVDQLGSELDSETVEMLRSVLSELTTNCVQHGAVESGMLVTVEGIPGDLVHVEVDCASGTSQPHLVRVGYGSGGGGLGLRLVDRTSTDWGIRIQGGRTVVWADLPSSRSPGLDYQAQSD